MRKWMSSLLLCLASIGLTSQAAWAGPLVATGTTYAVYVAGEDSEQAFLAAPVFDGNPEGLAWNGLNLVFSESETELGNGQSRINLRISADGELFPLLKETVLYGIGTFGDGLNFLRDVALLDARVEFRNISNELIQRTENLAGEVEQRDPWSGYFPSDEYVAGTEGIGGLGISTIVFDFLISEETTAVPEPAGILLAGLGLLAMLTARRQQKNEVKKYC